MYTYSYLDPKKMLETGRPILQGVGEMTARVPKDVVAHTSRGDVSFILCRSFHRAKTSFLEFGLRCLIVRQR